MFSFVRYFLSFGIGGCWAHGVNRRVVPDLIGLSFKGAWDWWEADRNQRKEAQTNSDSGQGCEDGKAGRGVDGVRGGSGRAVLTGQPGKAWQGGGIATEQ